MVQKVVSDPSLTPVAAPVDTFVAPRLEAPQTSGLQSLAQSLSRINPELQRFLGSRNKELAEREFAAGMTAAQFTDPSSGLLANKNGWQQLITEVRATDKINGTSKADDLVGASPHFRRGLVSQKATRIGVGLAAHMQQQWTDNEGGVQGMDDPAAVQAWMQNQTVAYTKGKGLDGIDPLITAEAFTPRLLQAEQALMSHHMSYRSKARMGEFEDEFSAGLGLALMGNSGPYSPPVLSNLSHSVEFEFQLEGKARPYRPNDEILDVLGASAEAVLGKGTRIVVGSGQEGDKPQHGSTRHKTGTAADFYIVDPQGNRLKADDPRSRQFMITAARNGAKGFGLGPEYMGDSFHIDLVKPGAGQDNAWGSYGNAMQAELVQAIHEFDSGAPVAGNYQDTATHDIQSMINSAVSNGMNPKKVNEMAVHAVIEQAMASGDSSMLTVLEQLDTGHGPLGNIAWVREARRKAAEDIDDEAWETDSRAKIVEDQQRVEETRVMKQAGYRAIMSDPFGDHKKMISALTEAGEPSLAMEMHNLQRQLQQETYTVNTNHEQVGELRLAINRSSFPKDEMELRILKGIGTEYPSSVGMALFDDLERVAKFEDKINDQSVRRMIDDGASIISDGRILKDISGNNIGDGFKAAMAYEEEFLDEILIFLEDNPETSVVKLRKFVRDTRRELMKKSEYQPIDLYSQQSETQLDSVASGVETVADPFAGYSDAGIAKAAADSGLTTDAYRQQVWTLYGYTPPK